MKKRGISPVIGAILLISLTVVIAGVVFIWMKNIAEKAEKSGDDALCRNIVYEIGDLRCEDGKLIFNAQNYASDLKLMGFMIKIEADGETKSFSSEPAEIDSLGSAEVFITLDGSLGSIDKVQVIPRIKSGDDFVYCEDKETVKTWDEIAGC